MYRSVEGGVQTLVGVVTSPARYFDDFDVSPMVNYAYYVSATDGENVSEQVMTVVDADTVPAPDAVLYETWSGDDLNIYWDAVDGFGVTGYRVEIVGRRTVDVTGTEYSYTFARNIEDGITSSVTVRVYTIDSDGLLSPSYATATMTHSTPSVVANASVGVSDLGFTLSWAKSTDPGVTGYDIALGSDTLETNYQTETYLYRTLLIMGSYSLRVRARNKFGQTSAWNTQVLTVHGPYAPTNLTARVIDNTVMLYWDAPSTIELPIVEYEISRTDTYAPGNVIGRKRGTFTTIDENASGTYQYTVAAVDSAGNVGATASVSTFVDEPPDFVLNVEWNTDFSDGTPTNVLVLDDGTAIAPYNVGQTWAEKPTWWARGEGVNMMTRQCVYCGVYLHPKAWEHELWSREWRKRHDSR